jgi:NAD+ synthase (glutamine-hydrolysing)
MAALADEFEGLAPDTTEENLQARCRGVLLMSISNKKGSLVLTTGNKSELAVGYSTLYGDMAGGFDVLKDVPKTLVYALCRYRNSLGPCIPERVIERPPSAELRRTRKTKTACRPTTCWTESWNSTSSTTTAPRPSSPRALIARTLNGLCAWWT